MATTFTQTLYQVIFSTKNRKKCIDLKHKRRLYKYIHGILINYKCHVSRINGIEDHLHIITSLPKTLALSSLMRTLKRESSLFIKREGLFPNFEGWQAGYAAFTYHVSQKDQLVQYVKNQEQHHQRTEESFKAELIRLLEEHEVEFDEKYLL